MDSSRPSKLAPRAITLAVTATFLVAWSASALSATTTDVDCDRLTRDFRALEIPVETFSVLPVDHVSIASDVPGLDSIDIAEATSEKAAPFLYLTPRVASVLRDIFDATREIENVQTDEDLSSSPVAESDSVSEKFELIDESDRTDNEVDLPLFQQQMFRTDI